MLRYAVWRCCHVTLQCCVALLASGAAVLCGAAEPSASWRGSIGGATFELGDQSAKVSETRRESQGAHCGCMVYR